MKKKNSLSSVKEKVKDVVEDILDDGKLNGSNRKEEPSAETVTAEKKEAGFIAKKDINLTYRKGDTVPQSQIDIWKKSGINYSVWFD